MAASRSGQSRTRGGLTSGCPSPSRSRRWSAGRLATLVVLLVRLAGLPGMVLAPLAGWLVGRFGAARVAVAGFRVAAAGLAAEAAGRGRAGGPLVPGLGIGFTRLLLALAVLLLAGAVLVALSGPADPGPRA